MITGPVSLAFPEDIDYPAGNTPDGWVFVPDPNQSPDAVQITGHFRTSLALPKHSDSGFATASAPKAEIVVTGIKSLPVQHVHGGPRTEN